MRCSYKNMYFKEHAEKKTGRSSESAADGPFGLVCFRKCRVDSTYRCFAVSACPSPFSNTDKIL